LIADGKRKIGWLLETDKTFGVERGSLSFKSKEGNNSPWAFPPNEEGKSIGSDFNGTFSFKKDGKTIIIREKYVDLIKCLLNARILFGQISAFMNEDDEEDDEEYKRVQREGFAEMLYRADDECLWVFNQDVASCAFYRKILEQADKERDVPYDKKSVTLKLVEVETKFEAGVQEHYMPLYEVQEQLYRCGLPRDVYWNYQTPCFISTENTKFSNFGESGMNGPICGIKVQILKDGKVKILHGNGSYSLEAMRLLHWVNPENMPNFCLAVQKHYK
jgi:hypothetical protein